MPQVSRRAVFGSVFYAFPIGCLSKAYGVQYDADRLAGKMGDIHGGHWKATVDHETGFILIKPRPRPDPGPRGTS